MSQTGHPERIVRHDPRIVPVEVEKSEATSLLERLPDHVLKSPPMLKWARTIVVILSIEQRIGTCFHGESTKQHTDEMLQKYREAKSEMDSWFTGETAFDRQALVDRVRLLPSAGPGTPAALANKLLSSYAGLRKHFFLIELLAGQQGRPSQRAASAIVQAVRCNMALTSHNEYVVQFLGSAEKIERWFWKSQEAMPSLMLLSKAELQQRSTGLLTKQQHRIVEKLPSERVSLVSLRQYQRTHPAPKVCRKVVKHTHVSRGFRGWSESASTAHVSKSITGVHTSEGTDVSHWVRLGRKRRVMLSDSDDEDSDHTHAEVAVNQPAVNNLHTRRPVVPCTPMPHKVDIRTLEHDDPTEQLKATLDTRKKRRRKLEAVGDQKRAWSSSPSLPPVQLSEATTCELVADAVAIGKVILRPVASSKVYCAQSAPRRLIMHTYQIMSMKGCFTDLAKLAQWTVSSANTAAVDAGPNLQCPIHKFVRERLGAQKGVALAHSARGDTDTTADAKERTSGGCFYFTQRRLYYSPNSDFHSRWKKLFAEDDMGNASNDTSIFRTLHTQDRLPSFCLATANEIFSVYVGSIASVDDMLIKELLELCGTELSPMTEWSREVDRVTGRGSLGIAKYRGPAGAACAMRTLNGLAVPIPTSESDTTTSEARTTSIQLKVGREQGKSLKQYETEVSRQNDRAPAAAALSLRTQFRLARQAVERKVAQWVRRADRSSPSTVKRDDDAHSASTVAPPLSDGLEGHNRWRCADPDVDSDSRAKMHIKEAQEGCEAAPQSATTASPRLEGSPGLEETLGIEEDRQVHRSCDANVIGPGAEADGPQDLRSDFELACALQAEEDALARAITSDTQEDDHSPVSERRQLRSDTVAAQSDNRTRSDEDNSHSDSSSHSDDSGIRGAGGGRVGMSWTNAELESLWLMIEISGPGDWDSKAEMLGTGRTGRALMSKFYARRASGVVAQSITSSTKNFATGSSVKSDKPTAFPKQTHEGECQRDNGSSFDNTPASQICSICMSVAVEPVTTPCHHTFCTECITYWLHQLEAGTMKRCPTCRQGLRQFSRQLPFSDELPAAWRDEVVDQNDEPLVMCVGQRVEADFGEYGTYYSGVVSAINDDGTVSIAYDDGDTEDAVKRTSVCVHKDSTATTSEEVRQCD